MSTRISLSQQGNTPFEQLIGHNQMLLEQWNELEIALFTKSHLSQNLLEQVRRTLAFENKCEYCMVKGGHPDFNDEDKKIVVATEFAQVFAIDHLSISQLHFEMLKEEFSEQQIAELCVFICFISASQKFGRIMNLTEIFQQTKVTSMEALRKVQIIKKEAYERK